MMKDLLPLLAPAALPSWVGFGPACATWLSQLLP